MNPIIHDLDCDIEAPEIIKVYERIVENGIVKKKEYQIDISFIPAGISIPLLKKYNELLEKTKPYLEYLDENGNPDPEKIKKLKDSDEKYSEVYMNLACETIAILTSHYNKALTAEWFFNNQDLNTLKRTVNLIVSSITKNFTAKSSNSKKKLNGNE